MWYTIVTVIHILACIFLVAVVLLQTGKGSDVGAVFGGSSQTLFGSSGAGNLLTKLTSATAIIFMLTSLTLTYGAAKQTSKSIFDSAPVPATQEDAPAVQPGGSADAEGTAHTTAEETTPAPAGSESAPVGTAQTPAPPEPSSSSPPEETGTR
jgi:preprotein translocase subunit SecG